MDTERQQQWIRDAFAKYISPNLVDHLIRNKDQLKLTGENRECSFVLTDLAGFTGFIERSKSEDIDVVTLLNEYIDRMVKVAFDHDGTIDRIIGDAVAVMFSAPLRQGDHAKRAVECALDMDKCARDYASEQLSKKGIALGMTRIGVNTGWVIIGNFGGNNFFDYRALGDTVNTASRLETVNKQLETRMCVARTTVDNMNEQSRKEAEKEGGGDYPQFVGRPIGGLVLKGKIETVEAFEPLTLEESRSDAVVV